MAGTNMLDLVEFEQDETHLILRIPKTTKPAKEFGLQSGGKNKDGTTHWVVPSSYIYAYMLRTLADDSILTVMRRKPVPFALRMELYEKWQGKLDESGVKLDIEKPVEKEQRTKRNKYTLAGATDEGKFTAKPENGKRDKVANML